MRCSIRVTTGVALLALWALCASSAMAQDPVKVAPDMYKVRLDNARVRVLEVTGKTALQIFGAPDDVKFRSSMTLFERVVPSEPAFARAIEKYFSGERDKNTIALLQTEAR